ncbi:MAG: hypothetical protein H6686_09330 [Fibrobacteria bacterium]|nr:hypothetical protein [Fibrobacteria bacterium]
MSVSVGDSAALVKVIQSGKSLEEVAKIWSATISRDQALIILEAWLDKAIITDQQLEKAKSVSRSDTTPPILILDGPHGDTSVPAGTSSIMVKVKATDSSGIDSIRISGETSKSSSFERGVSLAMGRNEVLLEAWDKVGLRAERTLVVVREAKPELDTVRPSVMFAVPSRDTTVSSSVSSIEVSVSATDASGVDTVWIGSSLFTKDPFSMRVQLQAGENTLWAIARDRSGNRDSSRLIVTRERDATDAVPPFGHRRNSTPRQDTTVSWDVESLSLAWVVKDETSLGAVTLNDSLLTSQDSGYSVEVVLAMGENRFVFLALDKAGNAWRDTLRVNRLVDGTKPVVKITHPSTSTLAVPNGTTRVLVKATASDASGIDSVVIHGKKIGSDPYQDSVLLEAGENEVVVTAWDKAGNSASDTVWVFRELGKGDITPPRIAHIEPLADTSVEWGTRSVVVKWFVTDDSSLASVSLAGEMISGTGGLYAKSVDLAIGRNELVLKAIDSKGNTVIDTLRIWRSSDLESPTLVASGSTRDTVLPSSIVTFPASWKVTDNDSVASVLIGGVSATWNSGEWHADVPLSGDSLWVRVVAKDPSGNEARDSVKIRRLSPPSITPDGGDLLASQAVTIQFASRLPGAVAQYSTDKSKWTSANSYIVSQSRIVYVRSMLDELVSNIDSAVFLYSPVITPAGGGFASPTAVSIVAPGAIIEDSLSTGTTWSTYSSAMNLTTSAKVFVRSRLGNRVSEVVRADFAFPPKLTPSKVPDTGATSIYIEISSTGEDSVQYTLDTTKGWSVARTGRVLLNSSGPLFARSLVGSAVSPVASVRVKMVPFPVTFFPLGGAYADTQSVILSSATKTATIQTSWDGVSWKPYKDSIMVPASGTLWSRAFEEGRDTVVTKAVYKIAKMDWSGSKNPYTKFRDKRDGQVYKMVTIDTLTWMASNLNYIVDSSWCYDNSADSCAKYGRLYQWTAAMGLDAKYLVGTIWGGALPHQGVCPDGWHVPSKWEGLNGISKEGQEENQAVSGWAVNKGTNLNGFHALAGGQGWVKGGEHVFSLAGNWAIYWSSSERDDENATWFYHAYSPDTEYWDYKASAYALRCVKK